MYLWDKSHFAIIKEITMNYEKELPMKKLHLEDIEKDHLMAFVYYVKVKSIKDEMMVVENVDEQQEFTVTGKSLIENALSADCYEQEIKESKTRVAEMLVHSTNLPLTVCFDKADGQERVLRGRLIRPEPLLGRSMVEDLDLNEEHRIRQVDHRTLKWLIVNNIKYIVH